MTTKRSKNMFVKISQSLIEHHLQKNHIHNIGQIKDH